MSTLLVFVALASLQQPGTPASRARQAREAAFDSSRAAVSHLADKVADVRSALEVYRRAVFNGTDTEVLTMAGYLGSTCHGMDSVALRTERTVCRKCAFQANVQSAFDQYRAGLPALRQAGARCVTQLAQLSRGPQPQAAKGLRRDVRAVGNPLVSALRSYERRLHAVLVTLNAAPPT